MSTDFSELLLLFTVYAFGGWLLETAYTSVRQKQFVNRGFMFGCFCPIYGFGALLILYVWEWTDRWIEDSFWCKTALIVISAVVITVLEFVTGLILDKVFQRKWWDYSSNRWSIKGYVCVEYSLLWGFIAYLLTEFLHPAVSRIVTLPSDRFIITAAWCVLVYFILDGMISIGVEWSSTRCRLKQSYAEEYTECVADLLSHEQVQRMDQFIQHGTTTCLKHSQSVSFMSYQICRKCRLDYQSAARGGLLHDLFLYDWHDPVSRKSWHGLTHPKTALRNAEDICALNRIERDIIIKHMWPLTPVIPRFPESWVVCFSDKIITSYEFIEGARYRMRSNQQT